MQIEIAANSDFELDATVKDRDGVVVTDATVTVSIVDPSGTAVVTDANMSHQGSGVYRYAGGDDVLTEDNKTYTATVVAVASGKTARAKLRLYAKTDTN